MDKKYKEIDGIFFKENTPDKLCRILLWARKNKIRIKIYLGDIKTGRLWGDVETCYIGCSNGSIKIPLCIYNSISSGGGALLDDCIVKIEYSNKKQGKEIYHI